MAMYNQRIKRNVVFLKIERDFEIDFNEMAYNEKEDLPMAAKSFAQNRIVRFFGDAGSSASMKRRQVPLEHGYHTVFGGLTVGDADK